MSKMNVVQVRSVGDVRLDAVGIPKPGLNDIVVKIHTCGICGSDPFYMSVGSFAPDGKPMPLGHEFSGTVFAKGEGCQRLEIGDRVVVDPYHNRIGNGGLEGGFAPYVLSRCGQSAGNGD